MARIPPSTTITGEISGSSKAPGLAASVGAADGPAVTPVLVAGGSPTLRDQVQQELRTLGGVPTSGRPAMLVVLQDESPPASCTSSVAALRHRFPATPLIFVATSGSEQLAVAAFRAGATDYLSWPVSRAELERAWDRLMPPSASLREPFLLGQSPAIGLARDLVYRFAPTPCNVLITGETGTGKELAATWLYRLSPRAAAPFVPVNCAAIPDTLVESELFGYERGAFSGAVVMAPGKLALADGGTVFLDEVGELSLSAQAKLLRVIEQREIQRLGARRPHHVDLRWITATNSDLSMLVRQGRFRADLYYRLNVAEISLPPLRERPEDIGLLAERFLAAFAARCGCRPLRLSTAALESLLAHDWPGNVRELRNVIESSMVRTESSEILAHDLPLALQSAQTSRASQETLERRRVLDALHATAGNKTEAARRLNWSRMTLYRKLLRYRIPVTEQAAPVTDAASQM